MTNQVIPNAAIVAATKVLYADKMSNHSGDNAPQILDACESVVKKILEAAAPYMLTPRTIATAAERAILQPGTIAVDVRGNAWKRGTGSWVSTGGDTGPLCDEDNLELTVLHEPTP